MILQTFGTWSASKMHNPCLRWCRGERGELAPHVFLLTCVLPTYGDDVFMLHIIPTRIPQTHGGQTRLGLKIIMTNHF